MWYPPGRTYRETPFHPSCDGLRSAIDRWHQQCASAFPALERSYNERSGTVTAVALTSRSQRAGFPLTLKLEKTELPEPSWVKVSQVRTLSTERLGRRLATVTAEELDQVIEGLLELIA